MAPILASREILSAVSSRSEFSWLNRFLETSGSVVNAIVSSIWPSNHVEYYHGPLRLFRCIAEKSVEKGLKPHPRSRSSSGIVFEYTQRIWALGAHILHLAEISPDAMMNLMHVDDHGEAYVALAGLEEKRYRG